MKIVNMWEIVETTSDTNTNRHKIASLRLNGKELWCCISEREEGEFDIKDMVKNLLWGHESFDDDLGVLGNLLKVAKEWE